MSADRFAREGLLQIPKILTLLDRNVHSPTFGCFDRNFWHYKIIDFPSGMAQEFCWPLALAYHCDLPGNTFHQQPALRDWVLAGIRFAAHSAHADGSCDDYFPFEKASGAAAFSLLACIESYRLFGFDDPDLLRFFRRRADWLAAHIESGRLSNHQALIVLCLDLVADLIGSNPWTRAREDRLERLLSWQDSEGWFAEYEGCDPGYLTLTVSCLARIHEREPDPRIESALRRAIELVAEFVHPDGTFGGEYTSRNTYNFFPHGFELAGRWMPEALAINDAFLGALGNGLAPCYADDHILGHHAWNYLLAWRDFARDHSRPGPAPRKLGRVHFPNAGLLIDRREGTELYLALNKGGVFKVFREGQLVASDTQVSFQVRTGSKLRNAVAHLVDRYAIDIQDDSVRIAGSFGWAEAEANDLFQYAGTSNPDAHLRSIQSGPCAEAAAEGPDYREGPGAFSVFAADPVRKWGLAH